MKSYLNMYYVFTTLAVFLLVGSCSKKQEKANESIANQVVNGIMCGDDMDTTHKQFIAEWEADTGHTVEIELIPWSQCEDKVFTLASAGSPPDFGYIGSRALGTLAENDLIVETNTTSSELKTYYPNVLTTFISDGSTWGYPVAFSTKAVYYNKELFAEAGYSEFPTTWDEFLKATKAVKDTTGQPGYGMVAKAGNQTFHQFLNWLYSNGGQVLNKKGEVVFDSKEALQTAEFLQELAKNSQSGPAAHDRDTLLKLFNAGKLGSYVSGPWDRREGRISQDISWGLAKIPHGPSGGHGTLLITDSLVVFKGTGKEELADSLAKVMSSPENQFKLETNWKMTPMRPHPGWEKNIQDDPTWTFFIEAIKHGGPEPLFTDYRGAQETFIQNVQSLVTSDVSPNEIVKNIQQDLEAL